MATSSKPRPATKIRETGGPTVLALDDIPDGFLLQRDGTTVIGVDPSGLDGGVGGWTPGSGYVGLTTATDKLLVGATAIMSSLEAPYDSMWRFTKDSSGKNLMFMVDNQSADNDSYANISAVNDIGSGVALFAAGTGTSDSSAGFGPGDHGLYSTTVTDTDPPAGAGMLFHAGVLDFRWQTYPALGPVQVVMKLTNLGDLLIGSTTPFDAGNCKLYIKKDSAAITYATVSNKTDGALSRVQHVLETAGPHYTELMMTPPSWAGGMYEPDLEAGLTALRSDGTGGIALIASAVAPIKFKTHGNNTRFQIDGDGSIGVFGHATQGQPTVTGSRGGNAALASLLTALAGFGWIVDSSS